MPILTWLIMGAVSGLGAILARLGWKKATGLEAAAAPSDDTQPIPTEDL